MKTLIICANFKAGSTTHLVANIAAQLAEGNGLETSLYDLSVSQLPTVNCFSVFDAPEVKSLKAYMNGFDNFIIASPIHNYSGSAVLKNMLDLVSETFSHKPVCLLTDGGSANSFASYMNIATPLMIHDEAFIYPKTFYASKDSFNYEAFDKIIKESQYERLSNLIDDFTKFSNRLSNY